MSQHPHLDMLPQADLRDVGTTCYIYTLHASNDPECRPRYVGFTCRLKRREVEHNTGREQGRKGVWVKQLLAVNAYAVLIIAHRFVSDDEDERGITESRWIEDYRRVFADLLNDLGGGHGVAGCSPEMKAKISAKNRGRVLTQDHKDKVGLSKIGKKRPQHVIEALRRANLGRKFSSERRESMSATRMGRKATPEHRAKISAANRGRKPSAKAIEATRRACLGKKHTPEHNAKIAAAGIGRKAAPETLTKRSASLRGKKRTPEQRERIRQAALLRFTNPEQREKCSVAQKLRFAKIAQCA